MKKKFKDTFVGKLVKGLVREGLQTLPVVGTLVTAFKEETTENPKGAVKLSKWHIYRLLIGVASGYFLMKGVLTSKQIDFILSIIGI